MKLNMKLLLSYSLVGVIAGNFSTTSANPFAEKHLADKWSYATSNVYVDRLKNKMCRNAYLDHEYALFPQY
jgi:hypothetical protein